MLEGSTQLPLETKYLRILFETDHLQGGEKIMNFLMRKKDENGRFVSAKVFGEAE